MNLWRIYIPKKYATHSPVKLLQNLALTPQLKQSKFEFNRSIERSMKTIY